MRVTNKMMNNTSLSNINKNKEYLDKLNNQMASEKKITRPSDDPIIAIRALKLRSNLTEVSQYYDKNLKDARAWLTATQDAIESTQGMLTSMRSLFTQGSNATNSSESRGAIINQLESFKKQIYDDGNADYAGRSLFTGYRTATTLTFSASDAAAAEYTDITEKFSLDDVDKERYVAGKIDKADISSLDGLLALGTIPSTEDIEDKTINRIRLAYDNINDSKASISVDIDGTSYSVADGNLSIKKMADDPDACYNPADDEVIFIPETGELILGKDVLAGLTTESEITAKYNKSTWREGDLRPENYFACKANGVDYEEPAEEQNITYDISGNQKIDVNTTCDEVYNPAIGRDIDEMLSALKDYDAALAKVEILKGYMETYDKADDDDVNKVKVKQALDAANKEVDATKEKVQKMFEHYQTKFDGYLKDTTHAATLNGSRISRVELVSNRLLDLKTTAKELADENENVEVTDMAIELSEAKLVYEAALMATGKVSQVTLLNYI